MLCTIVDNLTVLMPSSPGDSPRNAVLAVFCPSQCLEPVLLQRGQPLPDRPPLRGVTRIPRLQAVQGSLEEPARRTAVTDDAVSTGQFGTVGQEMPLRWLPASEAYPKSRVSWTCSLLHLECHT
jgi:hypothetical protein